MKHIKKARRLTHLLTQKALLGAKISREALEVINFHEMINTC